MTVVKDEEEADVPVAAAALAVVAEVLEGAMPPAFDADEEVSEDRSSSDMVVRL